MALRELSTAKLPPTMTPELMGQIALLLVQHKAMQVEVPAPKNFRRYLGSIAKDIGVDTETLVVFYEDAILPKVVAKMLGRSRAHIETA